MFRYWSWIKQRGLTFTSLNNQILRKMVFLHWVEPKTAAT
jgi:hypothetical protein